MAFVSFWWDVGIALLFVAFLATLWMKRRYNYWQNKGVEGPKPEYVFGNVRTMITLQEHTGKIFIDIYKQYKHLPFCGAYMMFRPTLVVNDPDLIKHILVKDFLSFTDHLLELNPKYEPLSENLFNVGGEMWKKMRTKFTPTFTTNKMKYMFETLNSCRGDLDKYMDKEKIVDNDVNIKEILAHFGMNIIASCAFGVECNAFEDHNSKFITTGNRLFNMNSFEAIVRHVLFFCLPEIAMNTGVSLIGKDVSDFFYNLVNDTIEYRNKNNIQRNDFLQIMMHLQEHGHVDESDKKDHQPNEMRLTTWQMAAQAFVFFIAGFETSSTTASFALYELALNPEIQNLLREDIAEVTKKHDNKLTYESIGEMTYLTKVIEETLRKHPPLPVLFRKCTKEYTIPNTNVVIEKDTAVMIPLQGIQNDPQYFPNPEKFDPERFSPENKVSHTHYSYMPFGEGPRICIGNRFGMMQTRLGLISIISKYKVTPCEKTLIPMDYDNKNLILAAKGSIWLRLTKIEQ